MRVKSLHLKNFKRFQDKKFDFTDPETGLAKDLIVLVGSNGSGKSTVLQAIAAALGTATGRLEDPDDLKWPGFDNSLAADCWSSPYSIEMAVAFDDDECRAAKYCYSRLSMRKRPTQMPLFPSERTLVIEGGHTSHLGTDLTLQSFRGHKYARLALKAIDEGYDIFRKIGTVFWYTEQRTATSLMPIGENGRTIEFDEKLLRRRLSDQMQFHGRIERGEYELRRGERDRFAVLTKAFQTMFPGRRFVGAVPRPGIDDVLAEPWFYLSDGDRQYEIGEMSGGERVIFPILFDFANWNINNSVILIDELELHLHPPMQQGLLRALRKLGQGNQFIITTHSNSVADLVPEEAIVRMGDE
ncbi:MAG: AAA family ATPase [Phycisphaerae bacterium]|nr:AAA family ATPase [Phycisphaerae bacterium]